MGRPPKPPDELRAANFAMRTTLDRRAKLERLATAAGVSLTGWIERQIDLATE